MAGLRCAEILIKGGLQVTKFEARERAGGRVGSPQVSRYEANSFECHQSCFLGATVDLSVPSWLMQRTQLTLAGVAIKFTASITIPLKVGR